MLAKEPDPNTSELDEFVTKQDDKHQLYRDVLQESIKSVKYYFICGAITAYLHTNRVSIYVLYADEFNPSSLQLSLLLYGFNFWNGIAALLYSNMANMYGYDRMISILLLIQLIGVGLEAFATSFTMLFIGIIIAQIALAWIIIAYISWILPLKQSKRYISYFYTFFMIMFLLGPITAGFISYYLSNRMIFMINLCVVSVSFLYSLIVIYSTQTSLEQRQLLLVQSIDDDQFDEDDQFPICLQNNDDNSSISWYKIYKIPGLNGLEWFNLFCNIIIGSTVSLGENAYILFYTKYIINDLNGSVINGMMGIFVVCLGFSIGNLLIPPTLEKFKIKTVRYILWISSICLAYLVVMLGFVYPRLEQLDLHWILDILTGIPLGMLSMSSEIILLLLQPTKYSGKVNGIKGLFTNWVQAMTGFIIALCWKLNHKALFYIISLGFGFGLMIAFIMLKTINYVNYNDVKYMKVARQHDTTDTEMDE